jgi:hypothetical protein
MADNTSQTPTKPRPPIGFPATAPPDFAVPEELTRLQLGAKRLVRLIFRRK